MIRKIFQILDRQDKILLPPMLAMVLLFSIFEMVSIGILFPYFGLIVDPERLHSNAVLKKILYWFPDRTVTEILLGFTLLLLFVYLVKVVYTTLFTYLQLKYSRGIYNKLVRKIFSNILMQPYLKFIRTNTADYTKAVLQESNNTVSIVSALLTILAESLTAMLLFGLLIMADYKVTLSITLFFAFCFLVMSQTVTAGFKVLGTKKSYLLGQVYRAINEALGNIKVLKLNCQEQFGLNKYMQATIPYNNIQVSYGTMQVLPRNVIELMGFSAFMIVVLKGILQGNVAQVLPLLTLFAISFYRVLPSINRIMTMYNEINFYRKSLDIIYEFLHLEADTAQGESCPFENKIELKDAGFSYDEQHVILRNINLVIPKGVKVGFVGESGVGKSTLVDVLIGLLKLNSGALLIDDRIITERNFREWRRKIGYIPQNIYLFDGTVAENVCLGFKYDEHRLREVLRQANIIEFLNTKEGIHTLVGEGGINLSGGQKQRVAIARALYPNPEVLVLDEATSALDMETEQKIITEILEAGKGKTIIMVSHRMSILEKCDIVYRLGEGGYIFQEGFGVVSKI